LTWRRGKGVQLMEEKMIENVSLRKKNNTEITENEN